MHSINNRVVGPLGIGLVFGVALSLLAGWAGAAYERIPGIACKSLAPYVDYRYSTVGWIENRAMNTQNFVCPLPDDSGLNLVDITSVDVRVYDGHPTEDIVARVCAKYQAPTGEGTVSYTEFAECSDAVTSTSSLGNQTIPADLLNGDDTVFEDGAYGSETGYLRVILPGDHASYPPSRIYYAEAHN